MKKLLVLIALTTVAWTVSSLPCLAASLDDHYLQQFDELPGSALQKALLLPASGADEQAHCGTPLKHGLSRDWNLLQADTQKTLAKQLAAPVLTGENTFTSTGGHFRIHYATSGSDAPPPPSTDGITPDWIKTVAATFEDVYTYYGSQGYRRPQDLPGGSPYNVYLRDLSGLRFYGQTTSDQATPSSGFQNAFSSYIEIDNNFTDAIYNSYTPLQSLQITAAHEFHHSIQYAYNFYFDVWYAEATSTWYEDELYDVINQIYTYVPAWFNNSMLSLDTAASITTGGGYGRWIFNRYLAEKHGPIMIRGVWEKLAGLSSPGNNADIPMTPVLESILSTSYSSSLGADFFGFTKRVYTRDWTTHTADIPLIHTYAPASSYSTYPVSARSVTLPHHSFAYYKFIPSVAIPNLTIFLTKTSGIQAAVFMKNAGAITEITSTTGGNSYTISGFSGLNPATAEVTLLVANTSNSDNHQANFSTDGTIPPVTEPGSSGSGGGGGGGGGGCFIATAAYGSYLHPQVQILRDFRDHYLLTNSPGRALVALYYDLSPPAADFISRHGSLRMLVRLFLAPVILAVSNPGIFFLLIGGLLGGGGLLYIRRRAAPQKYRAA